jgi:hypothetical protein
VLRRVAGGLLRLSAGMPWREGRTAFVPTVLPPSRVRLARPLRKARKSIA